MGLVARACRCFRSQSRGSETGGDIYAEVAGAEDTTASVAALEETVLAPSEHIAPQTAIQDHKAPHFKIASPATAGGDHANGPAQNGPAQNGCEPAAHSTVQSGPVTEREVLEGPENGLKDLMAERERRNDELPKTSSWWFDTPLSPPADATPGSDNTISTTAAASLDKHDAPLCPSTDATSASANATPASLSATGDLHDALQGPSTHATSASSTARFMSVSTSDDIESASPDLTTFGDAAPAVAPTQANLKTVGYLCPTCGAFLQTRKEALLHCRTMPPEGQGMDSASRGPASDIGEGTTAPAMDSHGAASSDNAGRPSIIRQTDMKTGAAQTIARESDGTEYCFGADTVASLLQSSAAASQSWVANLTHLQLHALVHEIGQRLVAKSQTYQSVRGTKERSREEANEEYFGLTSDATDKELDNAYRRMAKLLHPDKNGGTNEAKQQFQELRERYDALKSSRQGGGKAEAEKGESIAYNPDDRESMEQTLWKMLKQLADLERACDSMREDNSATVVKEDVKLVEAQPVAAKKKPSVPASPRNTPAGPHYSSRSMTPEEAEEVCLHQMVSSFAKRAVKGCSCVYIKESSGERCATQYKIDKQMEFFIVVSSKDPSRAEVRCAIAAIEDVYSFIEDGEGRFPKEVLDKLTSEEKELLLMIVYHSGPDKLCRLCLLEESRESRDTFLECLRIMCLYAESVFHSRHD